MSRAEKIRSEKLVFRGLLGFFCAGVCILRVILRYSAAAVKGRRSSGGTVQGLEDVCISVWSGLAPACICHLTGGYFLYNSSNVYRDIAMQRTAAPPAQSESSSGKQIRVSCKNKLEHRQARAPCS